MASVVKICNGALRLIGSARIFDINEATKPARACKDAFETSRDSVIRAYPWNFAKERVTLAQDGTAPAWGYSAQYQLPSDPYCLRVLEVEGYNNNEWSVEGRKLRINASGALNVLYLKREVDSEKFDAMFVTALEAFLSYQICYEMTGDKNLTAEKLKEYGAFIRDARSIDWQESGNREAESDDLISVRY